jgi:hypothetical protein
VKSFFISQGKEVYPACQVKSFSISQGSLPCSEAYQGEAYQGVICGLEVKIPIPKFCICKDLSFDF